MKICDICATPDPKTWAPAMARVTFELIPEGVPQGLDPGVLGIKRNYVAKDVCFTCLTGGDAIAQFVEQEPAYPAPEREEDI